MKITSVRIHLAKNGYQQGSSNILGFASIILDDALVIRDIKIVEDNQGRKFLGMPCRKLTDKCPGCKTKNFLLAEYCNNCGSPLPETNIHRRMDNEKIKLYSDVVHPINAAMRKLLHEGIIKVYDGIIRGVKNEDEETTTDQDEGS